jgi:hypothetical protein
MKRLELIANRSVRDDLMEIFAKRGIAKRYTEMPNVFGYGTSEPKQGDSIWPELNFLLIIYCDEEEARAVADAVREIKSYFPGEGVKLFSHDAETLV